MAPFEEFTPPRTNIAPENGAGIPRKEMNQSSSNQPSNFKGLQLAGLVSGNLFLEQNAGFIDPKEKKQWILSTKVNHYHLTTDHDFKPEVFGPQHSPLGSMVAWYAYLHIWLMFMVK